MLHLMPTSNPRVSVTLTPAVAAVLKEMCSLTGESQSATVAGLLEMSIPVFERVVVALRAAASIKGTATSEIAAGLERAQDKLEQQLGLQLDEMDQVIRPLLERAEEVSRRRPGQAPGGGKRSAQPGAPKGRKAVVTPVPLTGGSGPLKRAKKHPGKAVGRGRV